MEQVQSDIVISGAGLAGMLAAAAFANKGVDVVLVDPVEPVTDLKSKTADLRSTAFLTPAVDLISEIGLWDKLKSASCPLEVMRLADAGGEDNTLRHVADFVATEVKDGPFGWNVQNTAMRSVLLEHLQSLKNVQMGFGNKLELVANRSSEVIVRMGATQIRTKALIIAEGRNSATRDALGVKTKRWDYGQSAMAFAISHEDPHENISTEIHRTGGPFTLVPMPTKGKKQFSSVVWMERQRAVDELLKLPQKGFETALQERSTGVLGKLKLETEIQAFPIISQLVETLAVGRCCLIGESAHVVPPIGAQGLNMSLADIAWLFEHLTEVLDRSQAKAFEKARLGDMKLRRKGIDALNRAAMTEMQPLRDLRLEGLKLLHGIKPVRHAVMRKGLGV